MTSNASFFNEFLSKTAVSITNRSLAVRLARIAVLTILATTATASAEPARLSADEIVQRALQRQRQVETSRLGGRYSFRVSTISQKLAKDGSVAETETAVYRRIPILGEGFDRLVEENGVPLSTTRQQEQDRREAEFRARLQAGKKPEPSRGAQVSFDQDLVDKYDFNWTGREEINGRSSYVLSYSPRPGELPVRRRIDRALNKAKGKIWIDAITFDVARVTFDLFERVNIGWGIVGSITELKGRVESAPVDDDFWHPRQVEIEFAGRIFLTSLRRKQSVLFGDFQRVAGEADSGSRD